MKTLNWISILISLIILISLTNCEKETKGMADYRDAFIGNYQYTIYRHQWEMYKPSIYDTLYNSGQITKFVTADSYDDLYVMDDDTLQDISTKITIKFGKSLSITSIVNFSGVLTNKNGYHYGHSGTFKTNGEVEFSVMGLGGMGGGTDFVVIGVPE